MKISFAILLLVLAFNANGQLSPNYYPPFAMQTLQITNSSRMSSMGNVNVVSNRFYRDAGLFKNPALLSGNSQEAGININYKPWLRNVIPDMSFSQINGFYKLNEKNALGCSFTYYNAGEINFTNEFGEFIHDFTPNEMIAKLVYSHSFNKDFSVGTAVKYFRSKMYSSSSVLNIEIKNVNTLIVDLGASYRKSFSLNERLNLNNSVGIAITNLGEKVSYFKKTDPNGLFLPATLQIGLLLNPEIQLSGERKLDFTIAYQMDKMLIPIITEYDSVINNYTDISAIEGVFKSFNDAPGGFSEEMREIIHKVGFETRLSTSDEFYVAYRAGYHKQHKTKGNVKYFTTGMGAGYKGFIVDISLWKSEIIAYDNSFVFNIGYRF